MSDRVTNVPTLEERSDDIRAVMDAAGSESAVVFGASEGGSMACMFAAMHPERVRSLIIWGCQAAFIRSADYPWGESRAVYERRLDELERDWPSREYVRTWGAGLGPDAPEEAVSTMLDILQAAASPAAVVALERMNGDLDIRGVLGAINVPALIMARDRDPLIDPDALRDLAARIPGSTLRLFPGASHQFNAPWLGLDGEPIFAAIEEWVTGSVPATSAERFLTTMLFFDLVDSTPQAAKTGDRAWRELLDRHYAIVRRELQRHGGREIDTAGDGLLAIFDGPARAVRCARAIERADRGIGLAGRAGVHTAEVERAGPAIRGINVAIVARICGVAGADEVITSSTVRELSAGSGIRFEDRGTHALKGVEGERQLFAALE
jgi:class 3 adenylate cyclase